MRPAPPSIIVHPVVTIDGLAHYEGPLVGSPNVPLVDRVPGRWIADVAHLHVHGECVKNRYGKLCVEGESSVSADILRRAAEKIRENASTVPPGPWVHDELRDVISFEGRQNSRENLLAETIAEPWRWDYGQYLAFWSPDVAELVASVLDRAVSDVERMPLSDGEIRDLYTEELALARRLLGEA